MSPCAGWKRLSIDLYEDDDDIGMSLREIILKNTCSLKKLDVYSETSMCGYFGDFKSFSWPQLETLSCIDSDVMLFLQSPEVCQNLKDLTIWAGWEDNPDEISFPQQLPRLTKLRVDNIFSTASPDGLLPFLTLLQLASPNLKTLEFFPLADIDLFLPVFKKVKTLALVDFTEIIFIDESLTDTEIDSFLYPPGMPVNGLIVSVFPSEIREIFVPLDPHELISYPLLKEVALGRHGKDGTTNEDDEQAMNLIVTATWPRVSQKLSPAALEARSDPLEELPNVIYGRNQFHFYEMYESVLHRPIVHAGNLEYLSDLFLDFNEPFTLTEFCYFVHSFEALYDNYTRAVPDRPVREEVRMQVKIDLQRLRELLSRHAS